MRQRVIPILAPVAKSRQLEGLSYQTRLRGSAILNSPLLNKGTAFTARERKALGLTGLLPPGISTLGAQVKLAYIQYDRLPDTLSKNAYLTTLHARNQVLFYRLFSEHLREMIPVLDHVTLSLAAQRNHPERASRGVYLSIDHVEAMEDSFVNLSAGAGDIDLVLTTDGEQILGIGDGGMSGIDRSIGKLAVYTAAGGIDPNRAIPVMLDVGTDRQDLLEDPTYIGNRHLRIRGTRYDEFLDVYVKTVNRLFPNALLHWENLSPTNGRRILEKYRGHACTFNDDMQGTGAITLAAAISAVRVCGTALRHQRVVILGAGTAGIGIADQIRDSMLREGLSRQEAARQFWFVDRQGLLTSDMEDQLPGHQLAYARPAAESKSWKRDMPSGGIGLAEVVRQVLPTMLIGASSSSGSFTEAIIREMAAQTARPIILVLSTPPVRAEANPADLIAWTGGRALIATGSPCAPVTYRGMTYVVAQLNNAMLYPGLSLGAIVSRASRISDAMFEAAAGAVSSLVTVRHPGASLLPHIDDLSSVSMTVAVAVAEAAVSEGLARVPIDDIVQQVRDAMWQPEYREIQAS